MKKKLLLGAFIVCASLALGAEEDFFQEEKIAVTRLEESVITGEISETTVRNTPKNITIITSEDIEKKGAKSVSEALKGVSGIQVRELSGSSPVFDMRGQGDTAKSNVKVLLDGMPINSIDQSGYDTRNIAIDNVERIEVIPSGGSVLYGDGAVAGVINIITKSPSENKNYGSVGAEAGSDGLFKYNASYGTAVNDNLLLKLDFSDKSYDGYRDYSDEDLTTFDIAAKYLISDKQDMAFKYSMSKNEFLAPGGLTKTQVDQDRKQSDSFAYRIDGENDVDEFSVNYKNQLTDKLEFSILSSYREQDYDSDSTYFGFPGEYVYDTKMFYLKPQLKYSYGNKSYFILGTDLDDAETDVTKGLSTGKREKDAYGVYALNKYTYDNWEFTQGYRYQKSEYDTPDQDETFYNNAFDLSFNKLYSDTGNAFFTYSKAFRTPNTDELGYWVGDYKEQETDTFELGVKDMIFNTYVSASVFHIDTDDEIYYDSNANFGSGGNTNIDGETERNGIELSAEHYFGKLTLRGTYTYLDHEIKDGDYEGSEIPGVSSHQASIGTTYVATDKLTLNADLNYYGSFYASSDLENISDKEDSYITVDAKISYDFKNGFIVYGGIDNIFNEEYYDYVSYDSWSLANYYYPAAERTYYVGAKYNF